jgi:L,D-transpeptidase catalytic domain
LKKVLHILFILVITSFASKADNNNTLNTKAKTEAFIKYTYNKLSFKKVNKLSIAAFTKAYYGYLNLKEAGKIKGNALLTICDFTLSSNVKRLWVIDVQKKKIIFNSLVAHGMGSGEEYATKFSNTPDSHQSSLGFYTTGDTYIGDNGLSLKLNGIDGLYNNNAFERAIVIHGADYVNAGFAAANNRLGRSHGCPALPRDLCEPIITKIANGSCLFIYHTQKDYNKNSYWLNNRIENLPKEAELMDILMPENTASKWTNNLVSDTVIAKNSITASLLKSSLKVNVPIATDTIRVVPKVREKEFLYLK